MKKLIPIVIAGLVFVIALVMMRPESTVPVVVAAADLPAGHKLAAADLKIQQIPASLAPTGAVSDPKAVAGQTLKIARTVGDLVLPSHLGGEELKLGANERAVAIHVTDAGGMAGLLKPGDSVGVTVTFNGQTNGATKEGDTPVEGAFAKNLVGNLHVLYVSPDFAALDPAQVSPSTNSSPGAFGSTGGAPTQRKSEGIVVLAVPTSLQVIAYDFLPFGVESETRPVNLVDLLPALDQAKDVSLSLVLEPKQANSFITSGVFLPNLVVNPAPTPTAGTGTPGPKSATPVP